MRYGFEKLARDAKAAGIDGCLLTDVSVEEAEPYVAAMRAAGLDTVFLAAPTSTPRRLKLVAKYSTGFVYLVSRTGVTGERDSLSESVEPLVASMRAVTNLPLAVGFGISTPEQAREVARDRRCGGGRQRDRAPDRAEGERSRLEAFARYSTSGNGRMTREEALAALGGIPPGDRRDRPRIAGACSTAAPASSSEIGTGEGERSTCPFMSPSARRRISQRDRKQHWPARRPTPSKNLRKNHRRNAKSAENAKEVIATDAH